MMIRKIIRNLFFLFIIFGNNFFSVSKKIHIEPKRDTHNIDCLSKIIYFESGNQFLEGKIAVAYVVYNRTILQQFPNDYCSVINQKNQFTKIKNIVTYSKDYIESECVAKSFILLPDPTKGAVYFHNKNIGNDWLKCKKRSVIIGDHLFY